MNHSHFTAGGRVGEYEEVMKTMTDKLGGTRGQVIRLITTKLTKLKGYKF